MLGERKMRIRRARKADAREISNLRRKTLINVNGKDYAKEQIDYFMEIASPEKISENISMRDMFCIVNNENEIMGVVDLKDNKIGGLFVKHDQIGKNIGTKLLKFIEGFAKKKKLSKVHLFSTKTAIGFYDKNGYKMVEEFKWIPEEHPELKMTSYKMEKNLK